MPNSDSSIKAAVVITSIASPNDVLRQIAADCNRLGLDFYVIGDTKSPADFSLEGCRFVGIEEQRSLDLRTAKLCPARHYARKNIGYLLAISTGVDYIAETDDDNMPSKAFYTPLPVEQSLPVIREAGWLNIYRYYTDGLIWPRGLPLDSVNAPLPLLPSPEKIRVPIQQGLADDNPDVDAIYRLILPLPFRFERKLRIAIGNLTWCPYNSQNTIYFREAFPLLYLPAHCSFRMTDIWRSFVAQRIAWANGWAILFREPTVVQYRNDHNLMRDFEDEISGYTGNRAIGEQLAKLRLREGVEHIGSNMRLCYQALIDSGFIGEAEIPLLGAWLADIEQIDR